MGFTPYRDVNALIDTLDSEIARVLGPRLVGLYLVGSLVTGDFDHHVSDIDLIAVAATEIPNDELTDLHRMHRAIAAAHPIWDNRVEVIYVTREALQTFRVERYTLAVVSPGEPFHTLEAGTDWLINWYLLRTRGIAVRGPSPAAFLEPFTTDDLVDAAIGIARDLAGRVRTVTRRNPGVYMVLTGCRALHSVTLRAFTSKRRAAAWAMDAMPDHAPTIADALRIWRTDWYNSETDNAGPLAGAVDFADAVVLRTDTLRKNQMTTG
ncbi:MAG: DUF4111 domain-containing protein [Chloroflexota bacterium]|nr:MAG: DUF4111 domain-containing protein [Chloroflexota bacterium]